MTKSYLNDIIEKIEKRGELNFSNFLKFIYNIYEKNVVIKLNKYGYEDDYNVEKIGKIMDFNIVFNERFPDFDFFVSIEEQDYSYGIKKITAKDIYNIDKNKYILKSDKYEMHILA